MLTPRRLPAAQMASLSGLAGGPAPPHPIPLGDGQKLGEDPAPRTPGPSAGGGPAGRVWALREATGQADLVLEAPREVAHEEVGLVALHLSVLHWPLPQQGVEVHGQHRAGSLLIP